MAMDAFSLIQTLGISVPTYLATSCITDPFSIRYAMRAMFAAVYVPITFGMAHNNKT